MASRTLAHLSDLHLGRSERDTAVCEALVEALLRQGVDHVVLTGDVTHRGRDRELALFRRLFAPLLEAGRLSVVPGNHDRVGEDAGRLFLGNARVSVREVPGLYLVQVDSTGAHNRSFFASHGLLTGEQLEEVDEALRGAPAEALCAVLLHHHPLPLPEETLVERFVTKLGWPHAAELPLGAGLVRRCLGRADLLLHGHRHVPWTRQLPSLVGRPLRVANAGSSTERAAFPLYTFRNGVLDVEAEWVEVPVQGRFDRLGESGFRRSA